MNPVEKARQKLKKKNAAKRNNLTKILNMESTPEAQSVDNISQSQNDLTKSLTTVPKPKSSISTKILKRKELTISDLIKLIFTCDVHEDDIYIVGGLSKSDFTIKKILYKNANVPKILYTNNYVYVHTDDHKIGELASERSKSRLMQTLSLVDINKYDQESQMILSSMKQACEIVRKKQIPLAQENIDTNVERILSGENSSASSVTSEECEQDVMDEQSAEDNEEVSQEIIDALNAVVAPVLENDMDSTESGDIGTELISMFAGQIMEYFSSPLAKENMPEDVLNEEMELLDELEAKVYKIMTASTNKVTKLLLQSAHNYYQGFSDNEKRNLLSRINDLLNPLIEYADKLIDNFCQLYGPADQPITAIGKVLNIAKKIVSVNGLNTNLKLKNGKFILNAE
ncbi:unnamed protein product [Diadromus pulchellus idnoreovirus 1]|uniref:Uncharacterized protein S8 n=1 Tax=Diadromus pulchellus idnoreovirus 1 TaxID=37368 RepID=S8_DPIRV|nr:unnamed protein product [Diadromus pulchellus idnoreovirus 1]Q86284.1 RecName: Full=Uncharacterized protein S8 [Diadromus pulchellus idnoreovirus 1]CAA57563.1 unnamed protein product [Diadromus pulchellus idnoreovirus 1]